MQSGNKVISGFKTDFINLKIHYSNTDYIISITNTSQQAGSYVIWDASHGLTKSKFEYGWYDGSQYVPNQCRWLTIGY